MSPLYFLKRLVDECVSFAIVREGAYASHFLALRKLPYERQRRLFDVQYCSVSITLPAGLVEGRTKSSGRDDPVRCALPWTLGDSDRSWRKVASLCGWSRFLLENGFCWNGNCARWPGGFDVDDWCWHNRCAWTFLVLRYANEQATLQFVDLASLLVVQIGVEGRHEGQKRAHECQSDRDHLDSTRAGPFRARGAVRRMSLFWQHMRIMNEDAS